MSAKLDPEELATMELEELYRLLYEQRFGPAAVPVSPAQMVALGSLWIKKKGEELSAVLCRNAAIKRISSPDLTAHETAILIVEVGIVISEHVSLIEPVLISALLVRLGLRKLCHEFWQDSDDLSPDAATGMN